MGKSPTSNSKAKKKGKEGKKEKKEKKEAVDNVESSATTSEQLREAQLLESSRKNQNDDAFF